MTFRFPLLVAVLPAVVAVLLLAWGGWQRCRGRRWRTWAAAGAVVGVVFGPMLFSDRIVVDERGIVQTTGFWFAPRVQGFAFAGLDRVRVVREQAGTQRRNRTQQVWYAHRTDGSVERLDPGDLWDLHAERIVAELRSRGVRVE